MLTDPGSPLFCDRDGEALWQAARGALLALDARTPAAATPGTPDTTRAEAPVRV